MPVTTALATAVAVRSQYVSTVNSRVNWRVANIASTYEDWARDFDVLAAGRGVVHDISPRIEQQPSC